ncbi:hypothetical protein BKA70DRAFT_1224013 [Coprinopsis sp. MPI-PUGE-AT-0042]|nr:hypothetical protein BKA70DRAFT_1224013 [Coprinopsis sp. MPI-PUGE-AT-0042]
MPAKRDPKHVSVEDVEDVDAPGQKSGDIVVIDQAGRVWAVVEDEDEQGDSGDEESEVDGVKQENKEHAIQSVDELQAFAEALSRAQQNQRLAKAQGENIMDAFEKGKKCQDGTRGAAETITISNSELESDSSLPLANEDVQPNILHALEAAGTATTSLAAAGVSAASPAATFNVPETVEGYQSGEMHTQPERRLKNYQAILMLVSSHLIPLAQLTLVITTGNPRVSEHGTVPVPCQNPDPVARVG